MLSVWSASASAACALPLMLIAASTPASASPVAIDPAISPKVAALTPVPQSHLNIDPPNHNQSGNLGAAGHGATAKPKLEMNLNPPGGFQHHGVTPAALDSEKITLLLERAGDGAPLLNHAFDRFEDSSTLDLKPGGDQLQLASGSEAVTHLGQAAPGFGEFDLAVSGSDQSGGGGVVIPLPNPLESGGILLGAVFGGLWIARRKLRPH